MKNCIIDRLQDSYMGLEGRGRYVLYHMQAAQRLHYNPALNHALEIAREKSLPLLVAFCLSSDVPDANLRHYRFMLEGLYELSRELQEAGIDFLFCNGDIALQIGIFAREAEHLVLDMGYLNWQRELRRELKDSCRKSGISFTEIETESVVPVEKVSPKEEYAAATIRPKLLKLLAPYLYEQEVPLLKTGKSKLQLPDIPELNYLKAEEIGTFEELLRWVQSRMELDSSVAASPVYRGGRAEALKHFERFKRESFRLYATRRSNPAEAHQSELSPYLHFGQISPVELSLQILAELGLSAQDLPGLIAGKSSLEGDLASVASFCEELIVRRELSFNFCHYNRHYDAYSSLPLWARESMEKHRGDIRLPNYSIDILESAQSLDTYWNAAQNEMLYSGKMQNYMRMYWGKKILEWSKDPETAYYSALYLNNRYELDGRDPNSFAGVAWIFGKHDRPWKERKIFGTVRYMNAAGLDRKFDMDAYVKRIRQMSIGDLS